ncbi:MAG: response regulator [bacterium]|nr:response regulator [Candidatus Jorgensenbacteria bacterium]
MANNEKKVLIVEDHGPIRQALAEKLVHEGMVALEAKDGEEGLATALKEKPDLILLDIIMPRMGGMAMLEELRKDDWGKKVPVIILSNLSPDDKIMREVVETEPVYYLVKADWKIEDVVAKVKEVIAN